MSNLAVLVLAGLLGAPPVTVDRVGPAPPAEAPAPGPFRAWFEGQSQHPSPLPPKVLEAARAYRYVFIAGFLNEGFQVGYFSQNRRALLDAGVPPGAIELVFPKSGNTIEENVAVLRRVLPELAAKGPQKLVLIGHSKGAVEALAFMVAAPDFVRAHVHAAFLVQGAFGGSGIADYITGTGHPLDDRMQPFPRMLFALAAGWGELLDSRIDGGFQSLTHQRAAELWQRLLPPAAGPGASRLPSGLAERTFFIRSQRDPDQVCPLLWITARYLATYYGANDGLMTVPDQWVPGTGQILADLNADHTGLTVAGPVSDWPAGVRRAFTYALLMQLAGAFSR